MRSRRRPTQVADPHGGRLDLRKRFCAPSATPRSVSGKTACGPCGRAGSPPSWDSRSKRRHWRPFPGSLDILQKVSARAGRDEILKMFPPSLQLGFRADAGHGIFSVVLPELLEGEGVAQGVFHCYDVSDSLYACDARAGAVVRAAPGGAPARRRQAARAGRRCRRRPTFYGHETISAEMTREILERLKLPNAVIRDVAHLVTHHMFNYQEEWTDAAVWWLISRVGEGSIKDTIALRRADTRSDVPRERAVLPALGLADFSERVGQVLESGERPSPFHGLRSTGTTSRRASASCCF